MNQVASKDAVYLCAIVIPSQEGQLCDTCLNLHIKDSALCGMQLYFVYNVNMNAVGYTTNMALADTFGAAIDAMCAHHGWRVGDWDFMFHALFHVPRPWTPGGMGAHNGDVMTIYCRPAVDTN